MGLINTIIGSVAREVSESAYRPTHFAVVHANYKRRKSDIPGMPGHNELNDKSIKKIEYKIPFKPLAKSDQIDKTKVKTYINSHPDHATLDKAGWHYSGFDHKKTVNIKQHNEEVDAVVAEIEATLNSKPESIIEDKIEEVKMVSLSRPSNIILAFSKKKIEEKVEQIDELSPATKKSYAAAATDDKKEAERQARHSEYTAKHAKTAKQKADFSSEAEWLRGIAAKRARGIAMATKEETDPGFAVAEGKHNWDKEHKRGLTDTQGNRMLRKKAMPTAGMMGMSKAALAVLAAKANAVGKGGKLAEAYDDNSTNVSDWSDKKLKWHASDDRKHSSSHVKAWSELKRRAKTGSKAEKIKAYRADRDKHMEEEVQIDELSTDTYHRAAHKAAKKAMGDVQGRSGPIFKKYAGMANKFRAKGMEQEKREKAAAVKEDLIYEGGMPASVIKSKQLRSHMTDQEFAEKHADISDDELRSMAWRHGFGGPGTPGHEHYVKRRQKGLKEETLDEKHLTPAEMKKREEIAKAMEREHPGMPMGKKMAMATAQAKKVAEETIDEAKRGRPSKNASSDEEGGREHIIVQLRKAENLRGNRHTEFNDNSKHELPLAHVKKALDMHRDMKPIQKGEFEARLAKSHQSFQDAIAGKPAEPAKPKVTLAKSAVREGLDPSTHRSDRGPITTRTMRKPDGSFVLVKTKTGRTKTADIIEAKDNFAKQYTDTEEAKEEKKEGHKTPKGASADLTADSRAKYAKDPLISKAPIKLPPTVGNKAAGGEDTVYGGGKYAVAEEVLLNNLYASLNESNREAFDKLIETEEGYNKLVEFATRQEVR